jgi:hypothetical protein
VTLKMEYQAIDGGAFAAVDLTALRVSLKSLLISDSHAMQLNFSVVAAQHTFPFGLRKFIKLWDDAGTTPNGAPQSNSNPLFEGWIWEAQPAESNRIDYVAYDPSQMSGNEIPVMSTAWNASVGGSAPPQPGDSAVPRLIVNATIANDDDYAYERASNQSVANIIQMILDDAIEPLRWYNAAPGSGSAYINTEMANFIYRPQEKIVFTNQSIRSAIDSVTQSNYPEYAFLWTPGTRLWHWYSRFSAPAITLTLNDTTASNLVLAMELHRSLDGRYPAVKFYGPETAGPVEVFSTLDGTLTPIGPYTVLENFVDSGGLGTVTAYGAYQIVDPDKRRGARLLPTVAFVRDDAYTTVGTRSPAFEITFDGGNTWRAVESVWFDYQNGIVNLPEGMYTYLWSDHRLEEGNSRHFWTPNGFRLIWAPYGDPITVRYPPSGYAGSSYTVAGQKSELRIYDEMLSVGYNRIGIPVTTATRVTQYQELARSIWVSKADILYTGGCTLEGFRYEFCRLNKCINIAAVNANGAPIVTGWEGLNIILTDVEYNFEDVTTQLTFNSEALTALGDNQDLLKRRLKIGMVQKIRQIQMRYLYSQFQSPYTRGGPITYVSGIAYTDQDLYYDPNTGKTEGAL